MELHGKNLIAGELSAEGSRTFHGVNPVTGQKLPAEYHEATEEEIRRAAAAAEQSFETFSELGPQRLAGFLEAIARELTDLADELLRQAASETGLPEARLTGERARTINQLKMFADLLREGSWIDARIDRALPDRKPVAKPDLRRMMAALGPVAVFGASNFPLAFSVAGGDTASALAAGNPVIVKAHPAHPGTSEMTARAILSAAESQKIPKGVFSLIHAVSPEMSLALVRQPGIKAVGFTGSLRAGRALFDAAAARPEPIPVYAEMGSTNPVFILPSALEQRGVKLAEELFQSVTLGVGQFCTNPGLIFLRKAGEKSHFQKRLAELAAAAAGGTMLYQGIGERYSEGVQRTRNTRGVQLLGQAPEPKQGQARAAVFSTDAATFLAEETLREELFGPSTLLVHWSSPAEMEQIARALPGQLTATIHGTESDLVEHAGLVALLRRKVGRLLFNGLPTGVEVCPSMQHGGPYPATTDPHFTSVGTAAILRFCRPVCYQNFPDAALPVELRNRNTRGIWRLIDGKLSKEDV